MSVETGEFGFSYEHSVDIDTGTIALPTWLNIRFISAVDPQVAPVAQDAATYDDDGAPHPVKISESWTLAFTAQQHRLAAGTYLPEIEALLAATAPGATGDTAVVHIRWYDDPVIGTANPDDAFEGVGTVTMTRQQTGNDQIGGWSVTITGQGRRTQIANPSAGV